MTSFDERYERLNGPIHLWFGLTYSNYLVLCRSMMQSMPVTWQQRAVALFDELDAAFPDLPKPDSYIVTAAEERYYNELTPAEMKRLGVTYSGGDPDNDEDVYWDSHGTEHQCGDRILIPLDADPVPHYDRGRTFLQPWEDQ